MRTDAADIKARVHMPDLLPVDCKRVSTGRDSYRAQCPIHGGERLSFGMKLFRGGWWFTCWACGATGDAYDLVMALESCTFKEALRRLERDVGPMLAGPAPKRHVPALLLVCEGRGCGVTRELEEADRPYVGRTIAVGWELRARCWYCPGCARRAA